ncbi:MAG: hypothetical protein COV32_00480 [Candidatus Yonathbacteria bacterium CG10_big_fil_rev_8_21_14_0_10_43_136]|uniref:Vitamin K epoxide reductase domain-containing protein n=1 Tax=Candidatus Nomurabacteria bacterium CG2_30_43_9 TaxID=1805283 RepID=A0A1J5FYD4_9BACT|nr:MAG: hypothetical protein AUK15_02045 [Candidatus Nomurabacteria bacterium CG2_30_43_9]PIQ35512.1 MAG: hypothetical protein COW60_03600 [Candidatus Yonathbacteria bacterium CG17_big_fil_post_rev_8_21_14_2_50_43_9]PIR40971.1 MAG: hypothetical protein COV32_00480 [Candidatus Yonathbacteria bacterium CG10_big_fil_rev_8_21_14_0_10_43_136]PIX57529.1 MAG: hypothetical protein COZ48_00185 [Candidatus Yonathbacteria bacterium CG_4_10_14_3_um_filter_43_12]PJC22506.1 MAG: hypothetical protein CO060_00
MDLHLILFILSLVGLAEALYLNYECRRHRAPVCLIGNQCSVVWDSPYSKTFGVSNEILGLIYYTTLATVELVIFSGSASELMIIGEYLILISGAIMSCYFFYVQWRLIKAWCFWCTLSAIIVWVMVIVRSIY